MLEIAKLFSYQADTRIIVLFILNIRPPVGRGYHAGTDHLRLLVDGELVQEAWVVLDLVADLK